MHGMAGPGRSSVGRRGSGDLDLRAGATVRLPAAERPGQQDAEG